MPSLINLGDDGERRSITIRILADDRVIVVEAWATDEGTWERMATPFIHILEALVYLRTTYE
jgi:hypothetical protein